jgi:hypothetical protein
MHGALRRLLAVARAQVAGRMNEQGLKASPAHMPPSCGGCVRAHLLMALASSAALGASRLSQIDRWLRSMVHSGSNQLIAPCSSDQFLINLPRLLARDGRKIFQLLVLSLVERLWRHLKRHR